MNRVFEWQDAPEAEFAVIGDPVSHSLSPKMHLAAYASLGLPFRYVAIQVAPGDVRASLELLKKRGYWGVNVTVPHKEEALGWPTEVEPLALHVRAANTLDLRSGACINTDAPGFMETLAPLKVPRKDALVLGAGGSARALVYALVEAGWQVRIFNRTHEKAEAMAEEIGGRAVSVAAPENAGLILNTTSASLSGSDLPIAWAETAPDAIAYDLMYAKEPTPFLRTAAAHGLRTVDGRPLLAAQGALSFEWWLSRPAPRQVMLEALG